MRMWAIPSSSGDYRLETEASNPDKCKLTVENPTDKELEELGRFRTGCVERKWGWDADNEEGYINMVGNTTVNINAPISACGPPLAREEDPFSVFHLLDPHHREIVDDEAPRHQIVVASV